MPDVRLELDDFLPYLLADVAERASNRLAAGYRDAFGLSVAEWRVLAHLQADGPLRAADLVRLTGMHKVKVSRAVAALGARGWLEPRGTPGDARARALLLTAAGRDAMASLVPLALDWERALLDRLPAAQRHAALPVLRALRAALADS